MNFKFPRNAIELVSGIFRTADNFPFVGKSVGCRDADIYVRFHGLEKEPGYHILQIAEDVERCVNHPERYDISFEGFSVMRCLIPEEIMTTKGKAYFVLAVCVAADHHWTPCSIADSESGETRQMYTPERPKYEPIKKRKGCKP
jgi:hypothetical protein